MSVKVVTAPASEPLTLAQAKAHLRVLHSDEDSLIEGLIKSARAYIESATGQCLISQTLEEYFDCFPRGRVIELTRYPVTSLTSVSYLNAQDGTTYTPFDATGNYALDSISIPARAVLLNGKSWPTADNDANAVKIRYVAGRATAADVDPKILQAMYLLIGYYYQNREDAPLKDITRRAVDALIFNEKSFI